MKTGGSQCEHIKDLGFAMSIISCPDFWRRITPHDGCMGMHGRSVFGVWRRVYMAVAARMMRRCGGALTGRKEQEGLSWTARWGRQAGKRGGGERDWGRVLSVWQGQNVLVSGEIVQRGGRSFLGGRTKS